MGFLQAVQVRRIWMDSKNNFLILELNQPVPRSLFPVP